jgi:hypothetical protein
MRQRSGHQRTRIRGAHQCVQSLVERLEFDGRGIVIAADPDRGELCGSEKPAMLYR